MGSIFSRIIKGEIPSYKVAENESCFAFLDINPVQEGHTLVIPKLEVDRLFDLPERDYRELMEFTRKIARVMEQEFDCNRVGMMVMGLEVAHAHIHLIPITKMSDMDFTTQRKKISPSEMEAIAAKIRSTMGH